MRGKIASAFAALLATTATAQADVVISTDPTQNMSCSGGVCSPTAADAVLNVTDLVAMLGNGNVKVTTGSGATNISVMAKLTWQSTNLLTLDAQQSVTVNQPIKIAKKGDLTILYNDGSGGDLQFFGKGSVSFHNPRSKLTINGAKYTLVFDIATLTADTSQDNSGNFALAVDYNAKGNMYDAPPVPVFFGKFEGLGHKISYLNISGRQHGGGLPGLFGQSGGLVRDIALERVSLSVNKSDRGGALVAFNSGLIVNAQVSGKIRASNSPYVGGLVGYNHPDGKIEKSSANVVTSQSLAGGLVGINYGVIDQCFSAGSIGAGGGGLVKDEENGAITNSYASADVMLGGGGLVDFGELAINSSYSVGQVAVANGSGGFVGGVVSNAVQNAYWDTDTSGQSQGCGSGDCSNITGLSDAQLKSGLPTGFDPKIWAIDPKINGGYPYLINNPPQQ